MIVKNTYGTSVAFSTRHFGVVPKDEFTGSALQRKKKEPDKDRPRPKSKKDDGKIKLRSLSRRSKQKIRKKITCFARCYKRLSFVTLTFLNKVEDKQAVDLLRKFLDNVKKRSSDFQYVWVAERQTKNTEFERQCSFPYYHQQILENRQVVELLVGPTKEKRDRTKGKGFQAV